MWREVCSPEPHQCQAAWHTNPPRTPLSPHTPWSAEAVITILLPSKFEREIDWVSCALRGLTIAGDDGLTTEQFFFLHNSKLIGGEARNPSNKQVPLLLKRLSFPNSSRNKTHVVYLSGFNTSFNRPGKVTARRTVEKDPHLPWAAAPLRSEVGRRF